MANFEFASENATSRGSEEKGRQIVRCSGQSQNKAAARDATAVSTGRSERRFCNFAGCQQLVEGAPVSGMPLCAKRSLALLAG